MTSTEAEPVVKGTEAEAEPSNAPKQEDKDDPAAEEAKPTRKFLPGEDFPDLSAIDFETDESTDAAKKTINLAEAVKESGIIVFIYPRANTPGCTNQANGLRDNIAAVSEAGYKVFGLSSDKPKAQAQWRTKNNLPFPLLCDVGTEAIKVLGANKGEKGISRSHFVVAKGGKIVQAQYNIKPKDSVSAAVLCATGKAAIPAPRTSRRPTMVEVTDDDEPPKSVFDEVPSGKRRSKPSSRKVEAEQDALAVGEVEEAEEDDDDEDSPRKRGRMLGGRK